MARKLLKKALATTKNCFSVATTPFKALNQAMKFPWHATANKCVSSQLEVNIYKTSFTYCQPAKLSWYHSW